MKRIFCAIVALLMVAALFTGCKVKTTVDPKYVDDFANDYAEATEVDENGNEVYDADIEKVSFFTNGDCFVYSTGSDNTDHEVIFNTSRKMYQGKISVAVKLGISADNLYLNAKSNGLISAFINIKVKN